MRWHYPELVCVIFIHKFGPQPVVAEIPEEICASLVNNLVFHIEKLRDFYRVVLAIIGQ